jgi:hypothetical protein
MNSSISGNNPSSSSEEGIFWYTWNRRELWMFEHGFPIIFLTLVTMRVYNIEWRRAVWAGVGADQVWTVVKKELRSIIQHK